MPAVPAAGLSRAAIFQATTEALKDRGARNVSREGAVGTPLALPARATRNPQEPTGDETAPPPMPEREGSFSPNAVGIAERSTGSRAPDEVKATFWRETIVILLAVLGIAAGGYFVQDARLRELAKDFRDGLGEFRRELREDQATMRDDVREHEKRLRDLEVKRQQRPPVPVVP